MKNQITHSRPTLSNAETKAVCNVLRSKQIAKGKKVERFEHLFSQTLKIKNAVAVNSGSSALHMALLALGVKQGNEVIMPSYACSALLNAVLYVRATPVIVDVNEDDFNISLEAVRKKMTNKTKAIIVVHNFGLPADIRPLKSLGIPIVEDCAHAIGAKYKHKLVGNWGDISIFSFYATKMITTAEGGMVASNKVKLTNHVRDLIDYDQKKQFKLRYNYKMTDLAACIGIEQLKQLPHFIAKRQQIADQYTHLLKDTEWKRPHDFKNRKHVYFRYIINKKARSHIQKISDQLNQKGIECERPVFQPLHRLWKRTRCPVTDKLMMTAISIPIYPSLTLKQSRSIAQNLLQVLK
jgi:perosamine synthetase